MKYYKTTEIVVLYFAALSIVKKRNGKFAFEFIFII